MGVFCRFVHASYLQTATHLLRWEKWLLGLYLSIIFRLVVVSRRGPGGNARLRIAEKNLCYKAAFCFSLHRCMRIFEAHRSVCSTVASSPILAVQLAERALTACNYCQNHLLTLSVNVIGSASAGDGQHGTCISQFLQIPSGFLYCSERIRGNSCRHCITGAILLRCTHCSL